jgi:hypothetical protein
MICLTSNGKSTVITDEELEMLGKTYTQLRKDKIFRLFSISFQQYIAEFLADQMRDYTAFKVITKRRK